MNDIEIVRLCAEALGWKYLGAVGVDLSPDERRSPSAVDKKYPGKLWCLSGGNDWWTDPEGHSVCGVCEMIPDPLHDDGQCLALVKKFQLTIGCTSLTPTCWTVTGLRGEADTESADLNRAICETVAKLQKERT